MRPGLRCLRGVLPGGGGVYHQQPQKGIDQQLCVKCGECMVACPPDYDAVVKISPAHLAPVSDRPVEKKIMITLTVDDRSIQAPEDSSVLSACLAADITIPHLCWLETDTPADAPAACRLCFVEIDGFSEPVTACTVTVENGMTVHTDTEVVRRLQKTALETPAFRSSGGLQTLPGQQGLRPAGHRHISGCRPGLQTFRAGAQGTGCGLPPSGVGLLPNRCVLCGRCVRVCRNGHEQSHVEFCRPGVRYGGGLFRCQPASFCGMRVVPGMPGGLSYRGAGG
jgi:bidirectional [NiFe] hydrogenase diaphorase subunit